MRKIIFLLSAVFTALSLSGCLIDLNTFTKINDDGSGFRISAYSASGESDKEELILRYNLPEGGEWKEEEKARSYCGSQYPYKEYIYETKRRFKDLNKLTADYARKGAIAGNISKNKVSLKIKKGIIFTIYEYEEIFRDSASREQAINFWNNEYQYFLNKAADEVCVSLPDFAEKEEIKAFLDKKYRPYFDYFLAGFLEKGFEDFFNEDGKEKYEEFEKENSEENFSVSTADFILSRGKAADRQEMIDTLKLVYNKLSEEFQEDSQELNERNYDDAFGVYSPPIFMNYSFESTVVMPGRIIRSNSSYVKGNIAKWEFSPSDFFLKDYKLQVVSRKFNFSAVVFLSLLLLVLAVLFNLKSGKQAWKSLKSSLFYNKNL
ncbi:MAG: hypothetical protein V1933_00545 [Candidatus Omnitrophota bacterium]